MPIDVQGETTKRAKAGLARGTEDVDSKGAYGATFGCHNASGLQWRELHLKITGFKTGNKARVQLREVDAKGMPGKTIDISDQEVDANGEAIFDFDLSGKTVDANADFSVTIRHNPTKEKEVEYTITMQPSDEDGFPIS